MKKTAFAAFVAFWSSVGTLLAVQALVPAMSVAQGEETYTLETVAEHNSLDDCWMVIEGNVYDFTDYVPQHPTPPSILEPWCGREATEGMKTKGYGRDHSPTAWEMMAPYKIGTLDD